MMESPLSFGSETRPLLGELREYERVLEKTLKHKRRWQLAVSWR
jgi:hypothetical protein